MLRRSARASGPAVPRRSLGQRSGSRKADADRALVRSEPRNPARRGRLLHPTNDNTAPSEAVLDVSFQPR